ncbi:MAG: Gfo/Idh/MocA family protein [bacterium]
MGKRKRVRVGMIGCGGIALHHAARLKAVPEAKIAALADIDKGAIDKMRERFPETRNIPAFQDYRKMLDEVKLDAVEISTPHTLHFQQAMDALERDLHVLLEKPMVCKVEHAVQLIERTKEKKDKIVLVSYQRHYQPPFRYMRDFIGSGHLGNVTFVSALQCQQWLKGTRGTWRQNPELSGGGQLNDSGSHLLDIILWTTGLAVESVSAFIDNLGSPVDINSAINLRFIGGAQGNISIVGDAPCWHEDLTIWGTEGAFFYRNGKLFYCGEDGKMEEPNEMPPASDPDRNFIDAILGRDTVQSPPICGLRVIELTEGAWRSAATGQVVTISRSNID